MALAPLTVPGLEKPIYLPSDIDAEVKIISHPRFRSFQKFTGQSKETVHDTGNSDTTAAGEYQWAAAGRPGGSIGGYNAITDAKRVIITQPFDEIVWHAGTPNGNQSYGVEMAWGGGQDWDRVLDTNTALHGAICAVKDWDAKAASVLHQVWYGKWCSAQILNRKIWPQVQQAIAGKATDARKAAGEEAQPATYAKSSSIKALDDALAAAANPTDPALTVAPRSVLDPQSKVMFFWVGDRVRAIQDTPRLQYAFTASAQVGPVIPKGTEFDVNWLFIGQTDHKEYYLTPWGTRVFAEHTERVSDLKADAA